MSKRRTRLVERREIVGLSQEKLAELVGVERTTVGRWETGECLPQPAQRAGLAGALRVSVEELAGLLRDREPPAPAEPALTWPGDIDVAPHGDPLWQLFRRLDLVAKPHDGIAARSHEEAAYAQLVGLLARWAHTVNRRELLRTLGWAATAAAGTAELAGLANDEGERLVGAILSPSRVDHRVIDHIEAVLAQCRRQDDILGPQATLDTVLAQRNLVRALLPEAREAVRSRLLAAYAGQSRLAGWLLFNLNQFDAADAYYESARRSVHEAQDGEMASSVLGNMSYVATYRGQARLAIDYAVNARHWADQTDDLRLQASAAGAVACALALDGQEGLALSALDEGQALLARANAERASLAYFLPVGGRLNFDETKCYVYLGDYARGAAAAENDLAGMPATLVRERALTTLELSTCRIRAPKPDVTGAAQAVREAGALAAQNRSVRLVDRLRRGVAELEPWRKVPEVRRVHEELAGHGLV